MAKKITLLNMISNIILQFTNIIAWFVIPKLILEYFGSEVNGLVSSITQFLSYITLVEGGITSVIMASLYKPLINNNTKKISSIVNTASNFYRKIGFYFIIYSLILASTFPLLFKSTFSYEYVSILVVILSMSLLIQYMFSLTYRTLLNADKRGYVVSFTQTIILLLTVVLSYISVKIFPSIHVLKLISGTLFILQPIIYKKVVNKHYCISKNAKSDESLINQRWSGFAINVAAFVHNSTDIVILTLFTNLGVVSVYSIYSLVVQGIKSFVDAISNAIIPVVGKAYASGNNDELSKVIDIYEYIIFLAVFFMFSIAGLLITPFVMIYTKNVTDANYNQLLFGILLIIAEATYVIKYPHLNLSYSANKFKDLVKPAFTEAGVNIIISIILVNRYGLIGVALGTLSSMIYRLIYQVYFTKKLLKFRKECIFYKKLLIFVLATVLGIVISCVIIPTTKLTIISWLINAILYSVIFGVIFFVVSILFFKDEMKYLRNYLF